MVRGWGSGAQCSAAQLTDTLNEPVRRRRLRWERPPLVPRFTSTAAHDRAEEGPGAALVSLANQLVQSSSQPCPSSPGCVHRAGHGLSLGTGAGGQQELGGPGRTTTLRTTQSLRATHTFIIARRRHGQTFVPAGGAGTGAALLRAACVPASSGLPGPAAPAASRC